jgi:hypothetical protein
MQKEITQGLRSLSLATYFIPEKDGFIWLLHRELFGTDLLVVRVNAEGFVLPALVIFNSSNWMSEDFKRIILEEKARMPQNVATEFRYSEDGNSVLAKCFEATGGYCTMSELQFCAILPLKSRGSIRGNDTHAKHKTRCLEELLGLQELIDAAVKENERWCSCDGPEMDNMILCDSTRCNVGWYHKRCVGLDESYTGHDWLCPTCKRTNDVRFSQYDNEKFDSGIEEVSDMRIQRARSLSRAWRAHSWPDAKKVRDLYGKICCQIEMETKPRRFRNTVEDLEAKRLDPMTRNRAVLRNDPSKVTCMKQRFSASG